MQKVTSGWRPLLKKAAAYELPKENVLHSEMFTYVAFLTGYISIYVRNCVSFAVLFTFNYNRSD